MYTHVYIMIYNKQGEEKHRHRMCNDVVKTMLS